MSRIRRSKFHALPTMVEGIKFASKKEAARYRELRLLERAGEIRQLILQPEFGLYITPFVRDEIAEDEFIKCGKYIGDFQYEDKRENWAQVVEDVKSPGTKTAVYRLKKRLVEALYGITIRET